MEWTSPYFVMVGPMVVVPYCIVISMMLPLYIFKEERRSVGIKISLCNSIFHIFNVYMPCDDQSTDAYDMYNHVLNTVLLYCTNNNVDTYVLGGDFNTALNRETSRRTITLNKFVSDEYLYYCCFERII